MSTYVFFTYLVAKDWRYTMFWLPAFTLFAAVPLSYLEPWRRGRIAYASLIGLLIVFQMAEVYARIPAHATGYAEAADWVVQHRESSMVFFDGLGHGNFTYFIRALDADRSLFVLRGDKLLSSGSGHFKPRWLQVHAQSRQDIQDILDRYGVVHLVVERHDPSSIAIHHVLREFLRTGPFELMKVIPVNSTWTDLQGQALEIYRYRTPKPLSATHLELRVPVVGHTITVPIGPASPP